MQIIAFGGVFPNITEAIPGTKKKQKKNQKFLAKTLKFVNFCWNGKVPKKMVIYAFVCQLSQLSGRRF